MRAIKRVLALCLAAGLLMSSGCSDITSSGEERVPDLAQTSVEKKTTYRLHTVVPQELGREMEIKMSPGHYLVKSVRTDAEYQLKEMCVERGQKVKAGDIIAILQGQGSAVDAEQKRLELNAYAAGAEEMKSHYAELLNAAKAMPADTAAERELRDLRVTYAQAEYDLYVLQSSHTIEAMEAAVLALEKAAGEAYLYAPVDGSVRSLSSKYKPGDVIPVGEEVCLIYATGSQRIFGLSGSGAFVYGREVQVTMGRGDNVRSYTGRVVSSPEVQPALYAGTEIYVELDEVLEGRNSEGKAIVSYTLLDGVYAVPNNAINSTEGIARVDILDGENVRTRTIVRGPAIGGMVTVLQGLKEGDQVVVSSYNS